MAVDIPLFPLGGVEGSSQVFVDYWREVQNACIQRRWLDLKNMVPTLMGPHGILVEGNNGPKGSTIDKTSRACHGLGPWSCLVQANTAQLLELSVDTIEYNTLVLPVLFLYWVRSGLDRLLVCPPPIVNDSPSLGLFLSRQELPSPRTLLLDQENRCERMIL